ncbi:hypothetical protein SR39_18445 [Methylobacterium radiotolerans]|nr:hypothetical protein SR39_18445 [Methylobacterium radiotolerans]
MVLDRQRAAASPPFSACLQIRSARAAALRQDGGAGSLPVRERDRVRDHVSPDEALPVARRRRA